MGLISKLGALREQKLTLLNYCSAIADLSNPYLTLLLLRLLVLLVLLLLLLQVLLLLLLLLLLPLPLL